MTTLCSQEPRILCFQRLLSKDLALMEPHLFVYDSKLEQLECHRFDLDSQSTVVRVGVRLGYIDQWTQDVLLADVREAGLDTAVGLPWHTRQQPMECDLYPAVGFSRSKTVMDITDESKARAKSNLESALGTLEEQLALKQKRIERLQASLVSKKEIVQGCQEMMADRETVKDKSEPLETLECTAGWMMTVSRDVIWFGVKVRNTSDQALFHLRLLAVQQNSHGRSIPRLEGQGTDVLLGAIEVDARILGVDELLDRSKALARILTNAVLLHYSPQEGHDNYESLSSSTLLVPAFTRQDAPPIAWRSSLEDQKEQSRLGSVEEDMVARIVPCPVGEPEREEETRVEFGVSFHAPTEVLATAAARKAALLSQRFQ
ncbi:hypothetical protein BGX24_008183 [Mortierella sp. AD032]|nr:hypothetical protein BGX24_008183 [Mortierella sp. AD032]